MDIQTSSSTITITGNIKSVSDFQLIKKEVDSIVSNHHSLSMKLIDSLSMTSSVIGYLNKLVLKDGINVHMHIGNPCLLELLDDLNLTSTFNAVKA